eukprot:scaffold46284_cov39-Prasinocladus_malaysianus.AAC.1
MSLPLCACNAPPDFAFADDSDDDELGVEGKSDTFNLQSDAHVAGGGCRRRRSACKTGQWEQEAEAKW